MYEDKTYDQLRKLLEEDSCRNILEALADLYKESRQGAESTIGLHDSPDYKAARDFGYIEG